MSYYVGLDLGQMQDYTALAVLAVEGEGRPLPAYHVRHLERVELRTPYPAIVERVKGLVEAPELETVEALPETPPSNPYEAAVWAHKRGRIVRPTLVVDATGVGVAVTDMLIAAGLDFTAVTITGGDTATSDGRMWRVPKRDLVGVVQVLLQAGRLRFAAGMRHVDTLTRELLNFQVRIDPRTAHDSYGAWREGTYDDLVLAVALACWMAERVHGPHAHTGEMY